mmetsp:Transcript_10122/g.17823  ORF Transcript_10122/g.17823 Transcript_10122/m.17823 type:complete len:250 (-) Transcript_10122:121-870(-)
MTSCCPDTRVPALAPGTDYKAKGTFVKVTDEAGKELRCYKVGEGKNAVVVVNDVFGVDSGRHLGFCDAVADMMKCVVVCPDTFRGDVATMEMLGKPEFVEFLRRHPFEQVAQDLDNVYKNVVGDAEQIALAGFCWGTWVNFKEAARKAEPRIKGGGNFHPSFAIEQAFDGTIEAIVAGNSLPMLVAACKDDSEQVKKGGLLDDAEMYTLHTFEEENHGFMTQGDVNIEQVKEDVKKGLDLFKSFLEKIW